MNIKDYLHLYLGCEVETTVKGNYIHPYGCVNIDVVDEDSYENLIRHLKLKESYQKDGFNDYDWVSVKLTLRPLSDMTEEEANTLCRMQIKGLRTCDHVKILQMNPTVKFVIYSDGDSKEDYGRLQRHLNIESYLVTQFKFLIDKGFDIFGLIDAGLAIDKTNHANK